MSARPAVRPWLALALAAAILAGILVAWSPRYWAVTVGIVSLSAVGVAWAATAKRIQLPRQTVLVVLIGVWGWLQLSIHTTAVPFITLRVSLTWAMCTVAFLLASQILRDYRDRRAFLETMLWAVTLLAVEAMLQMYTFPGRVFGIFPAETSVFGTIFYTNQFAALMELAAPIALWLTTRGRVVAGGLGYAAMFAATIACASRAGVIIMLAELLVFLAIMLIGRRIPLKSAASIMVLLVALVAGASMIAGTERIWSRFHDRNPYSVRTSLLDSSLKMTAASPWLGFGLGTWRAAYPRFASFDMAILANEAHNDWAQWASEGGIPFLLLLIALVAWLAKPAVQSVWGLGVLAVLFHCYVDYPLREPPLQFFWFAMAGALSQLVDQSPEADKK